MPKAWSAKRERQYEHIKDSERKQGRSKMSKEQLQRAVSRKK